MTIGWGGVSRIDLEPAGCTDPECDADHGYTGVLASDDFSLRVSAAADGADAVAGLLVLRRVALRADPQRVTGRPVGPPAFVEPAYQRAVAGRRRARGRRGARAAPIGGAAVRAGAARGAVVRRVPGRRARRRAAGSATRTRRRTSPRCSTDQAPGTAGVPSTTATSLTSLGTGADPGRARPGRLHLAGARHRPAAQRAAAGTSDVDPLEWQPHPTAFARLPRAGVRVDRGQQARVRGQRADRRRAARRGVRRRRQGRRADRRGASRRRATGPSLTYLYDGDLDWTGHRYGVASSQWLQQLAMIDAEAEQLREALPDVDPAASWSPTTAWSTPRRRAGSTSTSTPSCATGVALLGGEARFRHLYCRGGAVDDVVATWRGDPRRPGRGADPRRGDRPRLVRRRSTRRAAAARRRRGGLPRRHRVVLDRRLPLRGARWSACTAR